MNYRSMGRTGLKVSELCLGCMTFGNEADEALSLRMIDRALDAGINFLDTANVYSRGRSEEIVGKALAQGAPGRRDQVVLATKVRGRMGEGPNEEGLSRLAIFQQVEASLRRLQTDHIDLYQVHSWDASTPLSETLEALNDLVRQGKVRYLGCSNFAAWQLARALWISDVRGLARFDCIQPRYNLVDRVIEMELLPLCRDQGVGVICYSPLAGGVLTGKYRPGEPPPPESRGARNEGFLRNRVAPHNVERAHRVLTVLQEISHPPTQTAVVWTLANPTLTSAIIGARNMEQLDTLLEGWGWELAPEEKARLDEVSALPPLH
jgi:aryl-alcohol dehydrogenase-like predicted oxidoreductase